MPKRLRLTEAAQRRMAEQPARDRPAKLTQSGTFPRPIATPGDRVQPFRCELRSRARVGELDCACAENTEVFVCGSPTVESEFCTVHAPAKSGKRKIDFDDDREDGAKYRLPVCFSCPHRRPFAWSDRLTIGVTHHKRPDSLRRLRESIELYLPGVAVVEIATGGNLSWARNQLAAKADTDFILLCEEDFELVASTPDGIDRAFAIFDHDRSIDAVGGLCLERDRGRVHWRHDFIRVGDQVGIRPSRRPMQRTPGGVQYWPCDLVLNWGVFRRALWLREPWDDDLPITEHREYFYRASQHGAKFAYLPSLECRHYKDRPGAAYAKDRRRNFLALAGRKHGVRFLDKPPLTVPPPSGDEAAVTGDTLAETAAAIAGVDRPNIVILGVGHSGTTILTRLIEALGWRCTGDVEYAEDVIARGINDAIKRGGRTAAIDQRIRARLAQLPPPWVLKDPRFVKTLGVWQDHFAAAASKPLLVWITRDHAATQASYTRRNEHASVPALHDEAALRYDAWPWHKLTTQYEQLREAAQRFKVGH